MLATTEQRPLSAQDFEAALKAAIAPYRFEDTRLHHLLSRPKVPATLLRKFARGTYASASNFLGVLARLANAAPDSQSRLFLLENLMEEEGIILKPSHGLTMRPEQRHVALAARFAASCGEDPRALAGNVAATTAGSEQVDRFLAQDRWVEAVGYMLIAQELKFGEACATMVELLRGHSFSNRDLAFFEVHIEADMEHGQQAIDIVTRHAGDAQSQSAALLAVEQGVNDWFASYGGPARISN